MGLIPNNMRHIFKDEYENTLTSNMNETHSKGSTVSFQTFTLEPPMEYEEIIQKLEGDIRKHIRIQNQLKLHIESLQGKVEEKEREILKKNSEITSLNTTLDTIKSSIGDIERRKSSEIREIRVLSEKEIKRIADENRRLHKLLHDQAKQIERNTIAAKSIPHSSIERAKRAESARSTSSHGASKAQDISGINIKKSHHRHGSASSNISTKQSKKVSQAKKVSNLETSQNTKRSSATRPVKQSPYSTMIHGKPAETENAELAMMNDWDKQKTMPIQARGTSSKKRKTECKKNDRKSERKSKNKSLLATANSKSLRHDLYKGLHQYNQGNAGNSGNTSSQTQLRKSQLYSTASAHNKSTNNLSAATSSMKAQLSK